MKTRALLLALPLLAVAPGCRDNGASVQIQAICAPKASCQFASKCDAVALGNPRLDPGVTTYLLLILQLENQLATNENQDTMRLNTNDAHVDEAVVEYGGVLGGRVVMGAQASVPAASTSLISVEIIPSAIGGSLPAPPTFPDFLEATAKLKLRGYFDDGSRFETAEFPVSIEIANGGVNVCVDPGTGGDAACPQSGQWPNACP